MFKTQLADYMYEYTKCFGRLPHKLRKCKVPEAARHSAFTSSRSAGEKAGYAYRVKRAKLIRVCHQCIVGSAIENLVPPVPPELLSLPKPVSISGSRVPTPEPTIVYNETRLEQGIIFKPNDATSDDHHSHADVEKLTKGAGAANAFDAMAWMMGIGNDGTSAGGAPTPTHTPTNAPSSMPANAPSSVSTFHHAENEESGPKQNGVGLLKMKPALIHLARHASGDTTDVSDSGDSGDSGDTGDTTDVSDTNRMPGDGSHSQHSGSSTPADVGGGGGGDSGGDGGGSSGSGSTVHPKHRAEHRTKKAHTNTAKTSGPNSVGLMPGFHDSDRRVDPPSFSVPTSPKSDHRGTSTTTASTNTTGARALHAKGIPSQKEGHRLTAAQQALEVR
jgi:hypothetical protein